MDHNQGNLRDVTYPEKESNVFLLAILQGLLVAITMSALLLLVGTAVIHWTDAPERYSSIMVFAVSLVGLLAGSHFTGKKIGSKGWLNGGVVGLFYVALVLILGFIFIDNFTLSFAFASKVFLGFIFGALGGIWGVNS